MENLEISTNSLLLVEERGLVRLGKGRKAWKNVTHKEFGIFSRKLKTGMKFSVQVTGKMLDTVNGKIIEACGETPVLQLPESFS